MLTEYQEKIDILLSDILLIKNITSQEEDLKTAELLNKLSEKLHQDKFLVVAFGGFSSGKSTFLNALLGNKILPTHTLPTTATINYIQYNKEPYAVINFKTREELKLDKSSGIDEFKKLDLKYKDSGKSINIQIEEIERYLTDTDISPYIKEVSLFYPALNLQNGIIFVDTPGTDSIIKSHKHITYKFIEKADVILFFIWGPKPFTSSDFEFLEDIKSIRKFINDDKFFFILNAIDGIEEESVDKVIEYVKKILVTKSEISNPNIIPISSRLALYYKLYKNNLIDENNKFFKKLLRITTQNNNIEELWKYSNFEMIENSISDYLIKVKGKIILNKTKDILNSIITNKENQFKLEKESFKKSIEEVEKQINEILLPLRDKYKNLENELISYVKENIEILRKSIDYMDLSDRIKSVAMERIENSIDDYEYSRRLYALSLELKKIIEESINEILDYVINKLRDMVNEIHKEINKNFDIELVNDITFSFNPDFNIEIPEIKNKTMGNEVTEEIMGFGILGGILAAIIPGGLGFFGGALLGSGFGLALNLDNLNLKGNISEIKDKIIRTIKKKVLNVRFELEETLDSINLKLITTIRSTFNLIMENIERDLNEVKNQRKKYNNNFKNREKKIKEYEKIFSKVKNELTNITR